MTIPATEDVQDYYDARVAGKLQDFTHPNPRIEAAVQLIGEWAPAAPKRVLEIGCGVGHTSWRMARAWPEAKVIGSDISAQSIEVAKTCFQLPNLTYREGPLAESVTEDEFDLVVMTDVYEHIAFVDRPALHAALRRLLSSDARFILTIPTPAFQDYARATDPSILQPVDEDITVADLMKLSEDMEARLVYYREVGIWRYGDYFHAVLARFQSMAAVALRQAIPGGGRAAVKRMLGRLPDAPGSKRDYLGTDVVPQAPSAGVARLRVSAAERNRLASRWAQRHAEKS